MQLVGPPPEIAFQSALPNFAIKKAMRTALDRAPPNMLIDAAMGLAPMRWLAQHLYFHRRGTGAMSFTEYEAKLRSEAEEAGARGYRTASPGA